MNVARVVPRLLRLREDSLCPGFLVLGSKLLKWCPRSPRFSFRDMTGRHAEFRFESRR